MEYFPRETNGDVPPEPYNSSNNLLSSPDNKMDNVHQVQTHPSPVAPTQTPADVLFKPEITTSPKPKEKTVDNELIEKASDLKETVNT